MAASMHRKDDRERALTIAAAVLVVATMAWAGWARVQDRGETDAPVVAERLLRFEDLPDGRLRATDARTGEVVQTITGEAGFERGTLRSFMRERRRTGAAPDLPLLLRAGSDGHLSLADAATGLRIDLGAFGATNAAAFVRLLQRPGETR